MTKVNSLRAVTRLPFTFCVKIADNRLLVFPSAGAEWIQKHMRKSKPLKTAVFLEMIFALRFRFIATSEIIQFTQDKNIENVKQVTELQQQSSELNKNKAEVRGG